MNLYQINQQMEGLLNNLIDPDTGEIDEAVEAELEKLKAAYPDAIEDFACYIKDEMAMLDAIKAEKAKLTERQQALANRIDRHKASLDRYTEGKPFKGPRAVIAYRKAESVEFEEGFDPSSLPEELVNVETTYKPIKAEIKKLLKDGEMVAGAYLDSHMSMSIK